MTNDTEVTPANSSAQELIDRLMESLKNFHNNTGRDENTQKNGKMFEEHVKTALLSFGYTNVSNFRKTLYKDMVDEIGDCCETTLIIPNDTRMHPRKLLFQQPYGSQKPPDFLLVDVRQDTIHFQPVEVKTGKKAATWNNNYPKNNWVYIFYGYKGVTYFLGENLINEQLKKLFEEYKSKRKELANQFNSLLKEMKESWMVVDYFKFEHRGCVDYKAHEKCCERENDVVNAFSTLSF